MVGWLAYDGDQKKAKSYLQQVIPPVELWRNKIGAHFAMHSPRSENAADLAMSVMFPLSFNNDAFYTGLLTLSIKTENTQSASLQEMQWSLTHTHRALIQRYWPR